MPQDMGNSNTHRRSDYLQDHGRNPNMRFGHPSRTVLPCRRTNDLIPRTGRRY